MENIFICLGVISVITYLFYKKSTQDEEIDEFEEGTSICSPVKKSLQNGSYPPTSQIVFGSLQSLGCQPELKDDNTLVVSYQGEIFEFDFGENQSPYVRIWDPYWTGVNSDNPNITLIKDAVNLTNYNFGPTIVMTEPDVNNVIGFHSRYDIMIHPAYLDNDQYLKSVLDSFFYAKEAVRNNLQNLNVKQTEQQKNRRPVGFTAPQ